ncbi:branched-chain amino acid aminotransferase [Lutimonas zeaxanthinifaciens]|uniref:branched-chain amino acid aminotransferase n=1 Tax=Lutimonas zeaxanthinifaciens TaxID=3060215 RepID=UPI00265C8FAE|nr:branched-chain amino acid aminotransferase [Lutimonas sp. YSD2104]WKK66376.1 branched-chain amino acid aminotransferase [Lutimonas sp. YSD2104]
MSLEVSQKITIEKTKNSKIDQVDFNNLPFGQVYTDHMLICEFENGKWELPKIIPYQNLHLDPSAKIFHYGQSVFEGMKAYKDENNDVFLFRPIENQKRMNISAKRLAMPELPESYFMEGLETLLLLDKDWIPTTPNSSLYIRPFMFASGNGFHASPSDKYTFIIACSPSGPYFGGELKVLIEQKYSRSANGGVGYAKAGGNYAGQFYPTNLAIEKGYQQVIWTDDTSHEFIEEAGAMNIFVRINDTLVTAPTSDRILDGITRKSIIDIARDQGISVEIRRISVNELVEASENGSLKEMFGAGTAAVISPIDGFGFGDKDYILPKLEETYATKLKKQITDIQYNRSEDKFGWRQLVK